MVSLQGAAIKTVSGEAQGKFTVLLLPPDQGPADTVVVIEGARWLDLVQIRSLLDQIPRAC